MDNLNFMVLLALLAVCLLALRAIYYLMMYVSHNLHRYFLKWKSRSKRHSTKEVSSQKHFMPSERSLTNNKYLPEIGDEGFVMPTTSDEWKAYDEPAYLRQGKFFS